jgi:hypothetical protein
MGAFVTPAKAARLARVPWWRNRILRLEQFVDLTFTRGGKTKMAITWNSAVFHRATSIAFVGMTICLFGCRDSGTSQPNGKTEPTAVTSTAESDEATTESYVKRLTADGWDQRGFPFKRTRTRQDLKFNSSSSAAWGSTPTFTGS